MNATALSAPIAPHYLDFRTGDVDEYMQILATHHAPVRAAPLDPAAFALRCKAVLTGGIGFSQAVCPTGVELGFESSFDGYGLSLPASGPFELTVVGMGTVQPRPGSGLMMDSSLISRAVMGPGTNLPRIAVSTAEMHGRLAEMLDRPVIRRVRFAQDVPLGSPAANMAGAITRLIYQGMEGDAPLLNYPAALTNLREAVLNLLLEGIPNSYSDQISGRTPMPTPGHVKRAMDFMAAHASEPLRVGDIAKAAGTSARALQAGFVRFKGVTPMEHLRRIRLDGVRTQLLLGGPGTSVAHVAHAWGFVHLSSFAARYLHAYGEKPSATLKRAPRR